eukprot:9486559-Pyramimonas_sp.AAC.1
MPPPRHPRLCGRRAPAAAGDGARADAREFFRSDQSTFSAPVEGAVSVSLPESNTSSSCWLGVPQRVVASGGV